MFKKILVCNRGEIALRIMRSCKELGIECVAVHSVADRHSLHVKYADESVCVGKASSAESYLKVSNLIAAAEITGAEAIHPGYGFLAENADFAETVRDNGLVWIGPEPQTIRKMGDKATARATAEAAGVPIVPGTGPAGDRRGGREGRAAHRLPGAPEGDRRRRRQGHARGRQTRAICGGPTRPRAARPRRPSATTPSTWRSTSRTAPHRDPGAGRRPRQRRPPRRARLLDPAAPPEADRGGAVAGGHAELRERMGEAAVKLCAPGRLPQNAGTVEFLLDADGEFYFMEMNTRIQVEHPVTEMVTGVDLVREQLLAAAGQPLDFPSRTCDQRLCDRVPDQRRGSRPRLHAGARPVTDFHAPGGLGVRVDSHLYTGYVVPPYYDSLLAKIIVHGRDRTEAIARMVRALEESVFEGVPTSIPFHLAVLAHPEFRSGRATTRFLEDHGAQLLEAMHVRAQAEEA
jgi:acetyl-CoA carboxylase, biotin carboxylase subunit